MEIEALGRDKNHINFLYNTMKISRGKWLTYLKNIKKVDIPKTSGN